MGWFSNPFQFSFQNHSKIMASVTTKSDSNSSQIKQIALGDPSPEKAGVGGSSPSLATTHKLPIVIYLWALLRVIGLPNSASVESTWSPNWSGVPPWYPWYPSWGPKSSL